MTGGPGCASRARIGHKPPAGPWDRCGVRLRRLTEPVPPVRLKEPCARSRSVPRFTSQIEPDRSSRPLDPDPSERHRPRGQRRRLFDIPLPAALSDTRTRVIPGGPKRPGRGSTFKSSAMDSLSLRWLSPSPAGNDTLHGRSAFLPSALILRRSLKRSSRRRFQNALDPPSRRSLTAPQDEGSSRDRQRAPARGR